VCLACETAYPSIVRMRRLGDYSGPNCAEILNVHYCTLPLGDATRRPTPDAELPALSAGVVRTTEPVG
jgi:hypothetical protein